MEGTLLGNGQVIEVVAVGDGGEPEAELAGPEATAAAEE